MKKIILSVMVVVLALSVLTLRQTQADNKSADGMVGDIKYSLLSPTQFAKAYAKEYGDEHAGDWVLLDNSDISQTRLFDYYGKKNLPDARGMFLRGMNENRKDGNPENKGVGDFQIDSTKMPNNPFDTEENGEHNHLIPTNDGNGGGSEVPSQSTGYDYVSSAPTTTNGKHKHKIINGDVETRPKNISVYIYVKVK